MKILVALIKTNNLLKSLGIVNPYLEIDIAMRTRMLHNQAYAKRKSKSQKAAN